jgi:hypothetical protein
VAFSLEEDAMNWVARLIGLLAFLVVLGSPRAVYACPS